ncbi:hypothetical protein [Butyrivibrio sp.]|jgi:hypothetical protein|nr:hypothetical protein [Butyrivibrio sp.]MBQ7429887.1 hypothetical protein [Butyrivibrio sp.]MBQ9305741.1 hypothetical protein [Butyrivibrio sp.]
MTLYEATLFDVSKDSFHRTDWTIQLENERENLQKIEKEIKEEYYKTLR